MLLLESTGSQAIASIAATVNLSIGSTVFSRGSNATNAGSGVISLKAGKTYLLRASLCFETNGSAFDETIGFFNITGNSYIGSYGRYHDAAGDSNKYASSPVAVFSPSVDSQVALRFLTANSANLNTLLAPSSIEVMELPSTESVLAGMVTPAALEYWQAKQVANGSPSNNITGFTFPLTAANFGTIGNVNGFSGATKANTNSAVFNDTSNTSVVIQSAGRYRITSSVSMDGSTGNATYSQILVNGAIVSENGFIVPATNNPEAVTTHHLANLNAGDTVSFAQIASAAGLQVSSYNYLIEQLPTLTVVNPGDVPVTTLQNGSVSVAAGTLTNSGSTTVNADVPGASITIPSAGTWRIAFEATANVQASTALEMAITDSSNVTVGAVKRLVNGAVGANVTSAVSLEAIVTTSGAATYKVRYGTGAGGQALPQTNPAFFRISSSQLSRSSARKARPSQTTPHPAISTLATCGKCGARSIRQPSRPKR